MTDLRETMLRDKELIKSITDGADLNNPEDIERIYKDLQSGAYTFETEVGRNFDDKIYELHEKVLSGEITSEPSGNSGKKTKKTVVKSSKTKTGKSVSDNSKITSDNSRRMSDAQYKKEIDELAVLELQRKEKRRKLMIIVATIVAVLSLGYCGVYSYMLSRTEADNEQLASLKGSEALKPSAKPKKKGFVLHKTEIEIPDILPEYETLYAKNQKLAGWLEIEGTNIDYPVMQTSDNEYYLNHNYNQQKDNNGSLFLDCECTLYPQSTNMIIYGHHMKSGNMFGNLQKYAKEDYWKKHPKIKFDTIYEKGTYEVMYVFYSKVYDNDELVFKYYQFINANSEKEFNYYMSEMEKLSLYDTGVEASYGDTLLTLSTCDHSQTDGRFAVVAKRVS